MDITQLRYFLATAETLNYTKAAKQLYISRQALRQALSVLEHEFEAPLFVNRRNKLSLTAAGEYLRAAGTEAVESFDRACKGMKRFAAQEAALTLALSKSLYPFIIPDLDQLLKRLQNRYPAFCLKVLPMSNDEAIEAVNFGQADCGLIIQMPCLRPGLTMEVLTAYDAVISCQECELPPPGPVGPKDLEGKLCIGMGSLEKTMRPFYDACLREGVQLWYEVVPDTIDAFYQVAHNHAFAFDILKEDTPFYDQGVFRRLEGYSWELGLLRRENSGQREVKLLFGRFFKEEYDRMRAEKQA